MLRKVGKHGDKGSALVEFALTVLVVLVVVFWAWELVMLLYSYNVMAGAAKEGVRYGIVHGSGNSTLCSPPCSGACGTSASCVTNVVRNYAKYSFHDMAGMRVTVSYPDGSNQTPNRVRVVVQYPYKPWFALGWSPPTINAAAEGRIVN
jgi:hypothetical protein